MQNRQNKHIIFFDLDGTILNGISSENRFILYLLFHGYIKPKAIWHSLLFLFRWLFKYKKQIFVKNKCYLSTSDYNRINDLGKMIIHKKIIKKIRPQLLNIIAEHKKQGDILFLLTGAPIFLAKILAEYLQIDNIEATNFEILNGSFTNKAPLQHPYGQEKLIIALRVCKAYGVDIKSTTAYANAKHDIFLLAAVGTPIAVTPDKKLFQYAKKRGWKIIGNAS